MSVSLQCRSCRATFHIPDMPSGLVIRCPQCGEKWSGTGGAGAEPSANRANLYPPGMGPAASAPPAAPSSPLSPVRAPSLLSPASSVSSSSASGPTGDAPELPPSALPPTALPQVALPPAASPPMALPQVPPPPMAMGTATMTGPPPVARGVAPSSPATASRPLSPPDSHSPTLGPPTIHPPTVGSPTASPQKASPPPPPPPPQQQPRGERKSSGTRPASSPPSVAGSVTASSPLAAPPLPGVPQPGIPLPGAPFPVPPPANPPPRTVQTARFIAADPTALKVSLGADGKLPELLLTDVEKAREEAVAKPKSSPPWLMLVVFGFSVSISMAMLFVDSDLNVHYERGSHASARAALQANYVGVVPPLAPYQTKIRLALQAYQKGDRDEEKRLYREVLDILKSESKNKSSGVTGMIDSPDPPGGNPSDRHLEALISILLTD